MSGSNKEMSEQILTKKLKKLTFRYCAEDRHKVVSLVENNKNTLKSVAVLLNDWYNKEDITTLFEQLVKLRELVHFRIERQEFSYCFDRNVYKFFKKLAENCPKISSLDIKIVVRRPETCLKIVEQMKKFPDLQRLDLSLRANCVDQDFGTLKFNMVNAQNQLKTTRYVGLTQQVLRCPKLTHLHIPLYIHEYFPIKEEFFSDIHKSCGKLRSLHLANPVITSSALTSLNLLSQLKDCYFEKYVDQLQDDFDKFDLIKLPLPIPCSSRRLLYCIPLDNVNMLIYYRSLSMQFI